MSKKVVVFGASGEIGGRVAHLAAKDGHQVWGVCRGNRKCDFDVENVEYINGDKYNSKFLDEIAKNINPDVIIDSVPRIESVDLYEKAFPNIEQVIFCSSIGTFAPLQYFPANENHPWKEKTAVNFIEQSLRDAYALERCEKGHFPVTILRPSNIIGNGRVPLELWGARDIEFFKKLKNSEPIIIAPCEEIMVQSGFNWDLASAFVLAIGKTEKVKGEIFIISCKHAITLGEYLKTAMQYLGSKSEISHVPATELVNYYPQVTMKYRMDFLLCHMNVDISKAERILGYNPKVTTQEGLIISLKWCESQGLL